MIKFFHKLFNPHCADCRDEDESSKICSSCEVLRQQLAIANIEKKQLLESILADKVVTEYTPKVMIPEELKSKTIPWRVRQQMLESDDREKAKLMRKKEEEAAELRKNIPVQSTEQLEKELGIVDTEKELKNG